METVNQDATKEDMQRLWSETTSLDKDERYLLTWYYRLNHCSLSTLSQLEDKGSLRKSLAKVGRNPIYEACLFGKYHRRPWR